MNREISKNTTLGQLVIYYPESIPFLNENNIDYCCKGNQTIEEGFSLLDYDLDYFIEEVNRSLKLKENRVFKDLEKLNNEDLIDFIVETHHIKELELLNELDSLIEKLLFVHYDRDRDMLIELYSIFRLLKTELSIHFLKEEQDLFPKLISNDLDDKLLKEILEIEGEHDIAGDLLFQIKEITNNYRVPSYACPTFVVTYNKLKELTEDIFLHVHKENSILFKRFENNEFENRQFILKNIIKKIHIGGNIDDIKAEFKKHFENVDSKEIADVEKALIADGMDPDEIRELCDIHASLFEDSIDESNLGNRYDEEIGHPAFVLKKDNIGINDFLDGEFKKTFESFTRDTSNRLELNKSLNKLKQIDNHYKIKENLLFPYLENKGITAPPKVMWAVDDEIRNRIKELEIKLEEAIEDYIIFEDIGDLVGKIKSMIDKEEKILMPLLLENLESEDWIVVAGEAREIGYKFVDDIEGASPSDQVAWYNKNKFDIDDEKIVDGDIELPSGFFTIEELKIILNTMPSDMTFVGADSRVHYFSENKNRVFPRTRTIIGRDVSNCHPPKSLDMVEKIIEDFKNNIKDEEKFWIQMGEKFILIRYYAIRNESNEYLGVLEVTEEISELRKLEGSKRLLD